MMKISIAPTFKDLNDHRGSREDSEQSRERETGYKFACTSYSLTDQHNISITIRPLSEK